MCASIGAPCRGRKGLRGSWGRRRSGDDHMEHSFTVIEAGVLTEARGLDQPVPWWSFTKTILAATALVLVRDGRLALDRAIESHPFTLRQLLPHQWSLV